MMDKNDKIVYNNTTKQVEYLKEVEYGSNCIIDSGILSYILGNTDLPCSAQHLDSKDCIVIPCPGRDIYYSVSAI
ncbi:hypothetical protein IJG22_02090 [Candidatus Saccharibacteria bacterium]|nr:hypothetical protein [Candidatus Saccharibacteria bacterium]